MQAFTESAYCELRRRVGAVSEDADERGGRRDEYEVAASPSIIDGTTARIACTVPK